MTNSRTASRLAILVVFLAAAASSRARAQSEIKIGATLPLTGAESRIGGFYKEGYDLAFEEWNKR
jgi:ABC-type branched-subunit amino acid transport system substrate-binding protein